MQGKKEEGRREWDGAERKREREDRRRHGEKGGRYVAGCRRTREDISRTVRFKEQRRRHGERKR